MNGPRRTALAAALCLGASACITGDYNRERVFLPLADAAIDGLRPGGDDLGVVLARLGAPLAVVERRDGMALAWGWLDETNWNLELQVPLDNGSFQFQFTNTTSKLPGVVVFLDDAGRVERVERGVLADLLPRRARPQPLDSLDEADAARGGLDAEQG